MNDTAAAVRHVEEVAAVLNVSARTIRRAIGRGEIAATRLGRQWLIPTAELDRLCSASRDVA